jgi:NADH-quinone oxidoreductase subunit J
MLIIFYTSAAVACLAGIMAISRREPMHGVLYLIVLLLAVSVIFFLLGAPFVGALQIIVYAGAIVILFLFIIMMLNPPSSVRNLSLKDYFGPLVLVALLGGSLFILITENVSSSHAIEAIGPKIVALKMFTEYPLAVQLAGILLFVGMIGAYVLGKERRSKF